MKLSRGSLNSEGREGGVGRGLWSQIFRRTEITNAEGVVPLLGGETRCLWGGGHTGRYPPYSVSQPRRKPKSEDEYGSVIHLFPN